MNAPEPYWTSEDGRLVIYHGDCREIVPLLDGVDLVLTDPPYGIGADKMTLGNGHRKVFRGTEGWDAEPADLTALLALKVPTVVWGGNYFSFPPSRRWLVWDKGTGDNDYADCELAWTNVDGVVKRYFRSWVGANAKERGDADRFHPTQKPVELMRWCLELFPESTAVLDPYMGAGTTLRAAADLGKRAVGIEINKEYCDIAIERLRQGVLL